MIPPVFIDENVGRRLMACLVEHGFELKTHDDLGLPRGIDDEAWIIAVAGRGWAAITTDIKQRGPLKHVVVHAKKLTAALAIDIVNEHVTALKVVLAYLPPDQRQLLFPLTTIRIPVCEGGTLDTTCLQKMRLRQSSRLFF